MADLEGITDELGTVKLTMKELKGTERRDILIANEKKCQAQWKKDGVFEANAPTLDEVPFHSITNSELHEKHPKFFGLMAYPYMNGTLHAGHSLTISKVEFAAGFARMQGKRALFPMGFHCTGMAVKACADKLVNEIQLFGQNFERYTSAEEATPAPKATITAREDVTKFTSKKGKSAAKTVKMAYQFQIMKSINIPIEDIHKFADPQHWFHFFPPLCQQDLSDFGARVDWRRSMLTTDINPYYDSFVRWQMNRLRQLNKIKFGTRYTIYSPKDGQPCMDHDRSEGEGVGPQEYIAIKLEVLRWSTKAIEYLGNKLPVEAKVYFVPATLRPETMYGQTCCFVSPNITYGIFQVSKSEFYIITDRAARNMAFQGIFAKNGEWESQKVAEIPGSACIGTLVNAPLSVHTSGVYILPMDTILATKGTGVVTSVPSDSPDDFITLQQLAKKPEFYGIEKEWAELEITPIIETPSYGNLTAPFLVKSLKITSSKDTKQLEQAKELAYKEGYYQGVMTYGDFKGNKVEDAKPKVKKQLLDSGLAFAYAEPEKKVVSRSTDECIVALMDQWYLDYGEESWKNLALEHVANTDGSSGMHSYSSETKNAFKAVLNWLNQWACARTYGHGSKLPWDPKFMVESLSDSTIYMAYYTVAHYLHSEPSGKTQGIGSIKPEQMTDEVWDYIFAREGLSQEAADACEIPTTTLEAMRREFEYWYPVDVNVSGKDLVPNHLTFFIYVHLAMWEKQREFWPRSVRSNGHLTLNGEKMSKSTGNFMTLEQLVKKFGADASRIAIADAGDGVTDANFEEDVADNNILRLYNLREWCQEQVANQSKLRSGPELFYDKLFRNEMNCLIEECHSHYAATNYKLALKSALYDFTSARDFYREGTMSAGIGMHKDLVFLYIEMQALLLAVIAPHWAEYVWLEILGKSFTIQSAQFPIPDQIDPALSAAYRYARVISSNITSAEAAQLRRKAKGKVDGLDPKQAKRLSIFVAANFPAWQEKYIDILRNFWSDDEKTFDEAGLMAEMKKAAGPELKKAMAFVQTLKRRLLAGEESEVVFQRNLAFDELSTLEQLAAGLKKAGGLKELVIVEVDGAGNGVTYPERLQVKDLPQSAEGSVPGLPTFNFENIV